MSWHGLPAMSFVPFVPSEIFYPVSFGFLAIAFVLAWCRHHPFAAVKFHVPGAFCMFILAASVVFLQLLSLLWDFGSCPAPSRDYPYLNSGRLISGAIIPFLILYTRSVEIIFSWYKRMHAMIIYLSLALMILPQIIFFGSILHSQYNWFHLLGSGSAKAVEMDFEKSIK